MGPGRYCCTTFLVIDLDEDLSQGYSGERNTFMYEGFYVLPTQKRRQTRVNAPLLSENRCLTLKTSTLCIRLTTNLALA
jgi:hypothetical protein